MSQVVNAPSPFLTVAECAAYLRVAKGTLYAWVHKKKVPFRKLGAKLVFHREDVDRWTVTKNSDPGASLTRFQQVMVEVKSRSLKIRQSADESSLSA